MAVVVRSVFRGAGGWPRGQAGFRSLQALPGASVMNNNSCLFFPVVKLSGF